MTRFTLYSRSYCHLCDDMLAALRAMQRPGEAFAIDVIDVDADPALVARFDELVPVLFGADLAAPELCHYFLDHDAVGAYLEQCKMGSGPQDQTPAPGRGSGPADLTPS